MKRAPEQADHDSRDDRKHSGRALGLPRHDEEADSEGETERTEVAGDVGGQPGVVAEDERGHRHRRAG